MQLDTTGGSNDRQPTGERSGRGHDGTRSTRKSALLSPAGGLMTEHQFAARLQISERKFHELRAQGVVGPPLVLGPRLSRWTEADYDAALCNLPRKHEREEPAQLLRKRIERLKAAPDSAVDAAQKSSRRISATAALTSAAVVRGAGK